MTFKSSLGAVASAAVLVLAVDTASAATVTFDPTHSMIELDKTLDLCSGCGVKTKFLPVDSWDTTEGVEEHRVDNFIQWTVGAGLGGELYKIKATLAFSSPSVASGSTNGKGGVGSIFGVINGGYLTWNGPGTVNFDDGTSLKFVLDGTVAGGLCCNKTTTGVTFVTDTPEPSPVPLPASAWLLLTGLGAAVAGKKLRKAA